MTDVPELTDAEKTAQPIPQKPAKDILPAPFKVPIPVCPGTQLTFWEKSWIGTKHFIYGFILAGVPAIAISHDPWYLLISGLAGGALSAWRKTEKDKAVANGNDWPDVLDKLLSLILQLIQAWRESKNKGVKK
jgi:hypothetical protein